MASDDRQTNTDTVPGMLLESARQRPDHPALWRWIDVRFEPVTYGELMVAVSALAERLAGHGVKAGERVAIVVTDRFSWGVAYLGVLFAGATAVPVDPLLTAGEIDAILTDADVALIIHDGKIEIGDPPGGAEIVLLESIWPGFQSPEGDLDIPLAAIGPDDLAAIIFTSGTTGQTKGVMLSHGNLVSDVRGVAGMGICDVDDKMLSILPIHHAFECTCGFLYPLAVGAQVAYARSLKSNEILADLRATRATIIIGVPLLFENIVNSIQRKAGNAPPLQRAMFKSLLKMSRWGRRVGWSQSGRTLLAAMRRKAGLDSIRLLASGGAALPPRVAEFCDTLGMPLLQGYGLTETSPCVTINRPDRYRYDTVGACIPTARVKIVDSRPDGVGEIAVAGPMVMKGYWRRPDETAKVMRGEWLLTGDLGMLEADGHLKISGRSKNLIVTGAGKNVYPEEVEAALCARPEIAEAVVYGGARPGKIGETVSAVVVPDTEYFNSSHPGVIDNDTQLYELLLAAVRAACEDLAAFKRVTTLRFQREPFAKTSTRKIKRFMVTGQASERLSTGSNLWPGAAGDTP